MSVDTKIESGIAVISYNDVERMAAAIVKSNLFGAKTLDQAISLMLVAQAEGCHPAIAARDYDIIQGRPAKKSEAMLRDFIRGGGKVTWHKLDDTIADATFAHPQGGEVRISWDMKRVEMAGLGGKEMYKKFPRQMLRSRCVSEGIRTVFPMATSGMYVPEEIQDIPEARKPAIPVKPLELTGPIDGPHIDEPNQELKPNDNGAPKPGAPAAPKPAQAAPAEGSPEDKFVRMQLTWPDKCVRKGCGIAVGDYAWYNKLTRKVRCESCQKEKAGA